MSDSSQVFEFKRLERMVAYTKALGNYCDEFYDATEPYTPHGDCPFWDGSTCALQDSHPSDWDDFAIVQDNVVQET